MEHWWNDSVRGKREYWDWNISHHHFVQRKVPRGLFLDWTRASAVRDRLLTVWIMARSYRSVSLLAFQWDVVIKWSQNLFFLHFMIVTWCTFPNVHSARVSLLVFCPLPTGRKRTFLVRFYRPTFPFIYFFLSLSRLLFFLVEREPPREVGIGCVLL